MVTEKVERGFCETIKIEGVLISTYGSDIFHG